jgi:hypothetical protein
MTGKIALVLVNDPGFHMEEGTDLFTGNAMTYYGRWTISTKKPRDKVLRE